MSASKKEAQYHFAERTLDTIAGNLGKKGIRRVLCIGAPTLAEKLRAGGVKCLLLDLDSRLGQFFVEGRGGEWCWYNMFNQHFFGGEDSRQGTQVSAELKEMV